MDFLTLVGDLESSKPPKIPKMTDGNREDFFLMELKMNWYTAFFDSLYQARG